MRWVGHQQVEHRAHGVASNFRVPANPVPHVDQGPQSRQYRRAAGEERELESTRFRQCASAITRRKDEIRFLLVPVMGEASTFLAI
jgi:hypothetical protein